MFLTSGARSVSLKFSALGDIRRWRGWEIKTPKAVTQHFGRRFQGVYHAHQPRAEALGYDL
jgi:hypothetical protein